MTTGYVCSVRTDWTSGALQFTEVAGGTAVFTVSGTELTVGDGVNIPLGTTTGTQIGTAASQKLGFYGATPVVQRAKASYNNWAAFTDVVDALVALGLFDQA